MRKKAEERKNEILDAANKLFSEKGYDGTSTNDILERVGIARGALYHHFKSKEEILDMLIERYSIQVLDTAKQIAADKRIPVCERFIRTMQALNVRQAGAHELIEQMHRPQNALMNEKAQRVVLREVPPILTPIIRDGIEQGLFDTPYPYECMELMIVYVNAVFDSDIIELSSEEKTSRLKAFLVHFERMLGAAEGSLAEAMVLLA